MIGNLSENQTDKKQQLGMRVYLFALIFYTASLPLFDAGISLGILVLIISWLFLGSFHMKWNHLKTDRLPWLLASIVLVYVAGFWVTEDLPRATRELIRSLYWLAFPVILSTAPVLTSKQIRLILFSFLSALLLSAGITLYNLMRADPTDTFRFRQASLIDHIPLAYMLSWAFWLILYQVFFGFASQWSWFKRLLALLTAGLFLLVLILQKAFTGYIFFVGASLAALVFFLKLIHQKWIKYLLLLCCVLALGLPPVYVVNCVQKFYRVTEYDPASIPLYTASGNPYSHYFADKSKENGNYVQLFVCHNELREAWNQRSPMPFDTVWNGKDSLSWVLLRYMTSLGLRKDKEGMAALSDQDIANVERGIPNPVYLNYKKSIYPRIYETIWEIDQYRFNHTANDKSFAQRVELFRLGLYVISESPWLGAGTGNQQVAYKRIAEKQKSRLQPERLGSPHNQYLAYLIKFGIIGTVWILFAIFWPFYKRKGYQNFSFSTFMAGFLFANLGESNFETFIGMNFFGLFYCLMLWNFDLDRT